MEIITSMIKEHMEKHGFTISRETGGHSIVKGVRLRESGMLQKNILTIESNESGEIICKCCGDSFVINFRTLGEVFNAALNAWEFYQSWEDNLFRAVFEGAALQDLVDIAEPVFCNPIFIANWYGKIFALSKGYAAEYFRPAWHHIVTTGRLPLSSVQILRESPNYTVVLYTNGASILEFPEENYTCIIGTLHQGADLHLYLQIMQYKNPITETTRRLADAFLSAMSKMQLSELPEGATSMIPMFCDLLDGQQISPENLEWALLTLGWEKNEEFLLLSFKSKEGQLTADALCGELEQRLPYGFAFVWKGQPVLLLREADFMDTRTIIERSAKELDFLCGVSMPFNGWHDLFVHYNQADAATRYHKSGAVLSMCVDHAWEHLIDQLRNSASALQLCHPAVLELEEHDKNANTQLLETLYVYLLKERNISLAAETLHVHRNTLQYRLHRISEIVAVDLEDAGVRAHLMLSYLLRMKH